MEPPTPVAPGVNTFRAQLVGLLNAPGHRISRLGAVVSGAYFPGMTPLERYSSINAAHEAVLEAVAYLDSAWGSGAEVREVGELLAFPDVVVCQYLDELAEAGLVEWAPDRKVAWRAVGVPVLGEVG